LANIVADLPHRTHNKAWPRVISTSGPIVRPLSIASRLSSESSSVESSAPSLSRTSSTVPSLISSSSSLPPSPSSISSPLLTPPLVDGFFESQLAAEPLYYDLLPEFATKEPDLLSVPFVEEGPAVVCPYFPLSLCLSLLILLPGLAFGGCR
jgi:hypothetical protein